MIKEFVMRIFGLTITTNQQSFVNNAKTAQENWELGYEAGRHFEKRMTRAVFTALLEDNHRLIYGTPIPERDIPAEKAAAKALKETSCTP
jgi:hypothetical protein